MFNLGIIYSKIGSSFRDPAPQKQQTYNWKQNENENEKERKAKIRKGKERKWTTAIPPAATTRTQAKEAVHTAATFLASVTTGSSYRDQDHHGSHSSSSRARGHAHSSARD